MAKLKYAFTAVMMIAVFVTLQIGAAVADNSARFVFADLLTDKPAQSRDFYAGLFGWRFRATPDRPAEKAIIARGREIGFLVEVEDRSVNVPESQWVSVLAVPSADKAAQATRRAGGRIEIGPEDDDKGGRFAVLRDRQGALFSAYSGPAPNQSNLATGRWIWFDLFTTNVRSASNFYAAVAGLKSADFPGDGSTKRRVFGSGGEPRAGLISIAGEAVRPAWVPYIAVRDLKASIKRAESLGGKLIAFDNDAAIILDPVGAAIGLHSPIKGAGS